MADNIAYMDKLVGQLIAELETLKLRENTLVIFMGDNGTGKGMADRATIGGKVLSGMKGTMLECGGLVPMIASWPAKAPAGRVCADLIDSSDFVTTFAEFAGAKLPVGMVFDRAAIAGSTLQTTSLGFQSTRPHVVCARGSVEAERERRAF
jgi:arylsulfatase A